MNHIDNIVARLMKGVEHVVMVAFAAMLLASIMQVYCRHFVPFPVIWTEELARLLNVAVTYLGAAVLWLNRHHIRIEVIDRLLPQKTYIVLSLILDLLMAAFLVALLIGAIRMAEAQWPLGAASMPWLSMGWVYSVMGVATVLIMIVLVRDIVLDLSALFLGKVKDKPRNTGNDSGEAQS